jgi:hypothetical protein
MADKPTSDEEQPKALKKARNIYVFSVSNHSEPMVTELQDNEEGHAALANMVRVETVLAAVLGDKIATELSSVVTVTMPGKKAIIDRMPIEPGRA